MIEGHSASKTFDCLSTLKRLVVHCLITVRVSSLTHSMIVRKSVFIKTDVIDSKINANFETPDLKAVHVFQKLSCSGVYVRLYYSP